jgi:hypothetical protein
MLWHGLMSTGLGHQHYVAHGSDLGAGVTAWLARDQPEALRAIHLATPGLAVAPTPRTDQEAYAAAVNDWTAEEGGYAHEHATKPATLGSALSDSPLGWPPGSPKRSSLGAVPARTAARLMTASCCCPPSRSTGPPERSPPHCFPTGPTARVLTLRSQQTIHLRSRLQ